MRPDEFRKLLQQRIFKPFVVHLSSGARLEIRDPRLAVVGRSLVWLEQTLPNRSSPIAARRIALSLVHVVWIEFLEEAEQHL